MLLGSDDELAGLIADLDGLSNMPFFKLWHSESISIWDICEENSVFFISLDNESYPEISKTLGRLILADLSVLSGNIKAKFSEENRRACSVYLDEAGPYLDEKFQLYLSKARSSNVRIIMATQSIGDIEARGMGSLANIIDNTAVKTIMRQSDPNSADYFSKMLGTFSTFKDTERISAGIFKKSTGEGSRREVEEFNISPNIIKSLGQGEGVQFDVNNEKPRCVYFCATFLKALFPIPVPKKNLTQIKNNQTNNSIKQWTEVT
jgi:type IV secretory pathway TraG/TraD family ATPase VirD4